MPVIWMALVARGFSLSTALARRCWRCSTTVSSFSGGRIFPASWLQESLP
jgi:hypothetical protein